MDKEKRKTFEYAKAFIKWLLLSCVVGAVGGFVGSIFHKCIEHATHMRAENPWLIYFLPLAGVVIVLIYSFSKKKLDTNRVIESIRTQKEIPWYMAPMIFAGTVITQLFGGSAGREGAALQLGGSIGYNIGKILKLREGDIHIIVMSGMSAVFAALFGTPVTAMFFALEVTSVGIMYYAGLMPCAVSAICAYYISKKMGNSPVCFDFIAFPDITVSVMLKTLVLAVLCAIICIVFCKALQKSEHYMEKLIANNFLRAFVGGCIIVLLAIVLRTYDYNGAGMEIIERAMNGEVKYEAFALKIIFTAITIAAGFKGGEIVPAFFVGSTFGCAVAPVLGLAPEVGAAIGFIALFCGVVNCPVASVILALEVFGGAALPIFALVCGVSYMMSGYSGLYKSQKIIYSKLEAKYVNANVE